MAEIGANRYQYIAFLHRDSQVQLPGGPEKPKGYCHICQS